MKTNWKFLCLAFTSFLSGTIPGSAQSTTFTYQGRLSDNGSVANGLYDLSFSLFGAPSGGTALAGPSTTNAVPVSNGVFTVYLDFGSAGFPGAGRWLEVAVKTNADVNPAVTLTPRQVLTSTPYAIRAADAARADTVADGAALADLLDDDGAGSGLDADRLDGLSATAFATATHNHFGQTWSGTTTGLRIDTTVTGSGTAAIRGRQGAGALVLPAQPAGLWGESDSGFGVFGASESWEGVYGTSEEWVGSSGFTLNGIAGMVGRADSPTGKGVWGQGAHSTGTNYGVQGTAYSPNGTGVYGEHQPTTGIHPGVQGDTRSHDGGSAGVLGRVTSTTPGAYSAGVRGINEGLAGLGIGVWGSHKGSGWGVYGESVNGPGVYAYSQNGHAIEAEGSILARRMAYITPRTNFWSISGDHFRPRNLNSTISMGARSGTGGATITAGSENFLLAPVHLPHGAVVRSLRFSFTDNSVLNLNAQLSRYNLNGIYGNLGQVDSVGAAGTTSRSVALNHTIENEEFSYEIVVNATGGDWSSDSPNLRLKGIVLTYTTSEAQ